MRSIPDRLVIPQICDAGVIGSLPALGGMAANGAFFLHCGSGHTRVVRVQMCCPVLADPARQNGRKNLCAPDRPLCRDRGKPCSSSGRRSAGTSHGFTCPLLCGSTVVGSQKSTLMG